MLYSPLHWDEAHLHRDAIAPIRLPDVAIIQTGLGREFVCLTSVFGEFFVAILIKVIKIQAI